MSDELEFPLSRGQKGLWWTWQASADPATYNTMSSFRIKSDLDVDQLHSAWKAVVDRHGACRTTVTRSKDGAPLQYRHAALEAPFVVHDMHGASDSELGERMRTLHLASCNLERESSVQLHVFRIAPAENAVLFRLHHLFHDFGSTDALQAELLERYRAQVDGSPLALPDFPCGYDQFVRDEAAFVDTPEFSQSLTFWERTLSEPPPSLRLPTDRSRLATSRTGASLTVRLAGRAALAMVCDDLKVPRFRVLFAAYVAFLSRYTGERDITVGAPVDCRGKKFAGMAGLFVNMLPFRFRVDPSQGFGSLALHVNGMVKETLANRGVPFPTMVERFWGDRGAALASPFFQTTFGMAKAARCPPLVRSFMATQFEWSATFAGLELANPPPLAQQEGMFDLSFWTWDLDDDGLALEIKYDAGLFSPEAIQDLATSYERLLVAMLERPETPIRDHVLVDSQARGRALRDPAITYEPAQAAFLRSAERSPDATAIAQGTHRITYAQTLQHAHTLARELQRQGVKPEEIVAIALPKSPAAIASMLGVLLAGAAFLPIDPAYPEERIRWMLDDAAPRFVVADAAHTHLVGRAELVDPSKLRFRERAHAVECAPESLAYVIYTSGSTGRPKGVLVPHRGVANLARALSKEWSLDSTSRVLGFAPLSFDACIADIFPTFMAGATLHLGDDPMPPGGAPLATFLQQARITHVTLPPSIWLSMPDTALPDLKVGISAGEPCPREVVARWGSGRDFFNNYGPTEVTVCATTKHCSGDAAPTIGSAIPGAIVLVADEALSPVPRGAVGELCLGGEGLALGYLNQPKLTRERFVEDPVEGTRLYRTGDLARLLIDGEIEYIGRRDDQVKVRGVRIELAEVEAGMRLVPGVIDAAARVCALGSGAVLVGYVVGDSSDVASRLRLSVPKHLIPSIVMSVPELPRAPTGKIDRDRLPPPLEQAISRAPLEGKTEEAIAANWREILGHSQFGATDDFFSSGGDSLSAVRVLHLLAERFTRSMTPDVLVRNPTIRALGKYIDADHLPNTCVVTLHEGPTPGFVFVHPAGGDLVAYRDLVARLGGSQSLGIRSPATFDADGNEESIRKLAERYVRELRNVSAAFVLVGWSLGGVIAQEMSCLLGPSKMRGLVLLDASPSFPKNADVSLRDAARPDLIRAHARLYEAHSSTPSMVPALIGWAKQGVSAQGSWNALCVVSDEMSFAANHDTLLRSPAVDDVARWILRTHGA